MSPIKLTPERGDSPGGSWMASWLPGVPEHCRSAWRVPARPESSISAGSPGHFQWKMVFRHQDLGAVSAHTGASLLPALCVCVCPFRHSRSLTRTDTHLSAAEFPGSAGCQLSPLVERPACSLDAQNSSRAPCQDPVACRRRLPGACPWTDAAATAGREVGTDSGTPEFH